MEGQGKLKPWAQLSPEEQECVLEIGCGDLNNSLINFDHLQRIPQSTFAQQYQD